MSADLLIANSYAEQNWKRMGYVLGNPVTDDEIDTDSIVPFVHLKKLISDELYESFKKNCKGEYLNPDESNASCMEDKLAIKECIGKVWTAQILEPSCKLLRDDDTDTLLSSHPNPGSWCRVN
ncbi:hypothetical protein NC651_022423 [Populus alba x Populus x berolinensis]|nr:hypothetical protein NC651_022423 [Populus alba x Populus x berolinensis]